MVPEVLYPRISGPQVSWDPRRGELSVGLPATPAACLVRLAGSLGMPAPVNTAIARLVHEAEGKGSPKLSASELQIRVQSGIALTI